MTDTTQATPATLSGRIATWVSALRYEDLPEEVVERTKLLILDQLGLQLRGATLPNVQPVLRLADSEPGKAEATLAHSGARTTVSQPPGSTARSATAPSTTTPTRWPGTPTPPSSPRRSPSPSAPMPPSLT